MIKGLAWAVASVAAIGGTACLGAISAYAGAISLTWAALSVIDEDLEDALLGACGCGIAALGAKVTLATLPYLNRCLNNACYHLQ